MKCIYPERFRIQLEHLLRNVPLTIHICNSSALGTCAGSTTRVEAKFDDDGVLILRRRRLSHTRAAKRRAHFFRSYLASRVSAFPPPAPDEIHISHSVHSEKKDTLETISMIYVMNTLQEGEKLRAIRSFMCAFARSPPAEHCYQQRREKGCDSFFPRRMTMRE